MSISIDSRFDPEDYYVSVARGRYPNTSLLTSFGYSPNTASVTNVNVWELATAWSILTTASTMEILSSSANDTAAGTGARTVLVMGLDANFNQIQEVVIMNGTSVVPLVNTYIVVNSVLQLTVGSNHANVGNITVRITSAGAIQGYILAGAGISRMGRFTCPDGYICLFKNIFILVNKAGSTTASADLNVYLIQPDGSIYQGLPETVNNATPSIITLPTGFNIGPKQTIAFTITSVSTTGLNISTGASGVLAKI